MSRIMRFLQRDETPRVPSDPSDTFHDWEKRALLKAKCPDCGGGLLEGPRGGGMAVNVKCANDACGHEFNICPLPAGQMMGHRLTKVT